MSNDCCRSLRGMENSGSVPKYLLLHCAVQMTSAVENVTERVQSTLL